MVDPFKHLQKARAVLTQENSPFAVTETEIDGRKMKVFGKAPENMRDIWAMTAAHADNIYLAYEDESWTYTQAHQEVAAIANWLLAQGIKPGDHVAIAMRNFPEWVTCYWAILSVGAVCVAMNAWWIGPEMAAALHDAKPKILICDDDRLAIFNTIRKDFPALICVGVRLAEPAGDVIDFADIKADTGQPSQLPPIAIAAGDIACIFYTSGTTAQPKGAMLTHHNCVNNVMNYVCIIRALDIASIWYRAEVSGTPPPVGEDGLPPRPPLPHALVCTPLFHVTANNCVMHPTGMVGGKLVLTYKWDAYNALQLIERHKITIVPGVPVMARELINHPDFADFDTSSLLTVGGGGAAFQTDLVQTIGEKLTNGKPGMGYGLTETSGLVSGISKDYSLLRPDSVGMPALTAELEIRDPSGRAVPQGEPGEIYIYGPSVMKGYYNKPEETAKVITDGWLRTGDIGRLDEHGFLYIIDRLKDMLIRGGENIFSSEVEIIVYQHDDVAECAVFGVPDERLGEEVGLAVCAKPGKKINPQDIRAHCAAAMAAFKVPRYIWVLDGHLPRNSSGKISKTDFKVRLNPADAFRAIKS